MEKEGNKPKNKADELIELSKELSEYIGYVSDLVNGYTLQEKANQRAGQLFRIIGYKSGALGKLITELTNEKEVLIDGTPHNMWNVALRIPIDKLSWRGAGFCFQVVNRAIGQLMDEVESGKREIKTGKLIGSVTKSIVGEKPKAFIAHEGETRALTMLKEFLEALGVQYFIAESKASDGRSIEKQVDWTQSKTDFAICLATKGKAINKKTSKHYMAPNIIDELGRARQVFGNKIILLVQKGVEVHTNIKEIVYETFTTTNMEGAFIKITKELRNWGFIRTGKIEEQI